MKRALESLTEEEFNSLKASGLLWELYPDAPEYFEDKDKCFNCKHSGKHHNNADNCSFEDCGCKRFE